MKKLKLDFFKEALSKEQMKKFVGGSGDGDGPVDAGSGDGTGGDVRQRKCCWDHDSTRCSNCKYVSDKATCQSGATLTTC